MSYMFYRCSNLKSLDLSSFILYPIRYMLFMFGECNSLERIDLSNVSFNYELDIKNLPELVFENCNNLKYLNILLYKGYDIFTSIANNTNLVVCSGGVKNIYQECKFYMEHYDQGNGIPKSNYPNSIMDYCFSDGLQNEQINSLEKNKVPNICCMKPFSYDINLRECVYDGPFNNITLEANLGDWRLQIINKYFKYMPD